MIEVVISFLNSRLNQLGLFKEVKGLCEKIQLPKGEDILEFPAEWCEGNYVHIDNLFNWEEGLAYHRQIGETTEEEGDEAESPLACDILVTRSYPMRLVCLVPKNALEQKNNDQYIDGKLATNVINTLKTLNNSTLNTSLNAETTSVEINSIQKDRYAVWAEEYSVPTGKVPGFEYAFFYVDYTILITATHSCFENFDCDETTIPEFCAPATILDSDGLTTFEVASGGSGTCTPCETPSPINLLTCQQLNDGLTQAQRQVIQRVNTLKTNQTTSYAVGDDGDLEEGRPLGFFTLDCNNAFGNTNRFTDSAGNQNYDGTGGSIANYVIDHATGLGWWRVQLATDTWANQLTAANAATNGGFTDWFMPNVPQGCSIANYALFSGRQYKYAPFNISPVNFWLSTTPETNTTFAFHTTTAGTLDISAKTTSFEMILCRNHY
jgi:hypothetical protein